MGERSAISWTDGTFNGWIGCQKVSEACRGCYAQNLMQHRMGRVVFGEVGGGVGTRQRTSESNWRKPLAWNKDPAKHLWKGEGAASADWRPFVFCASLADVFDNAVPPEWRRDLFELIRATPNLTWLLLTKRPGNIVKLFKEAIQTEPGSTFVNLHAFWPHNAAIGCTVVTQEEADRDIPKLLAAKRALNPAFAFVSMEPLLGPVDLTLIDRTGHGVECFDALRGMRYLRGAAVEHDLPRLDWVITGGETDQGAHRARPVHPDWIRAARDQCTGAGVSFHLKQWGEYAEWTGAESPSPSYRFEDGTPMVRVGKKAAGRALDGVVHDARPTVGA